MVRGARLRSAADREHGSTVVSGDDLVLDSVAARFAASPAQGDARDLRAVRVDRFVLGSGGG